MEKLIGFIGIFLFVGLAYLCSDKKKNINWKSVGYAFVGQIILAVLLIKTPLWKLVELTGNGVNWLIQQANEGITFVFGDLFPTNGGFILFFNGLMPIVFLSSLVGLLFHYGILQKIILFVGKTIAKLLKVDTLVAVNGVSNMVLGQTDSLFITKSYLPKAKDSVIFATLVGGMTSISCAVISLYSSLGAPIEWIIISIPLTVLSTLVLTQILMPTEYTEEEIEIEVTDKGVNAMETMMNYAQTAFKAVIGISIALMVFISAVTLLNGLIGLILPGVTLESIIGLIFRPFALLMGVPYSEVATVSHLLATKLVINETAALAVPTFASLSINTKAMVTVVLMGFAGIASIGIQIGAYSAIAPNKVPTVAKLGVKALLCATLVNILSGAVIGLML
jgi:CNT family concentrative nucleoside transporter